MSKDTAYIDVDWDSIIKQIHVCFTNEHLYRGKTLDNARKLDIIGRIIATWEESKKSTPDSYFKDIFDGPWTIHEPKGEAFDLVDIVMRCFEYLPEKYQWYIPPYFAEHSKSLDAFYFDLVETVSREDFSIGGSLDATVGKVLSYFTYKKWDFMELLNLKIGWYKSPGTEKEENEFM